MFRPRMITTACGPDSPQGLPTALRPWWQATGNSLICVAHETIISLPPSLYTFLPSGKSEFPVFGFTVDMTEIPGPPSSSTSPPGGLPSLSSPTTVPPVTATVLLTAKQTFTHSDTTTDSSSPSIFTSAADPSTSDTVVSSMDETSPATSSIAVVATGSGPQSPPSSSVSSPATSLPTTAGAASHNNPKTARIVAGVLVPLVVIALGIAAFIIYKRRRRAHDRREWERTHEEIADAVRQVGAATPVAILAAGPPAWGDAKPVPDGDSRAPPMDISGGTPPGSLGHPNGSDHGLLSHSRESSA
ncbi:hypothetical protein MSAN_00650500 [Mycena sanguinolenta]|uniref:Uncharacterized protein n=1 Tax=Mycena sanguinolenta TaxID=230812 RepID=A0A8H7DFE0_9AGAR|nr:hypothetical protein MSAN_00650500 [Mycena sanguinolenta]